MKKLLAFVLASAMMLSLAACGGGGDNGGGGGGGGNAGNTLTIFNTKSEIQSQMEEMAKKYSADKGVNVEVYYSNDTVAAHMATKYASNDPYVLAMVDAKDIYSLGPEHAIDLSGEPWVANTTQAISIDGKVLGFPVCIEARGLMYNADAIKKVTGKDFNPASVKTTADFKAVLDELVAGGMAAPVGIMKEDWSLAAHFMASFYEEHSDVQGFIDSLKDGSASVSSDPQFNSLMDTFDVLKQYNYAASSPVAAERETSEMMLAQGDIAFMYGGNWDWALIAEYDYTDGLGMMPVPQDNSNGGNESMIGGGSKYFFIDNSASAEMQQAAKDFLNWLVNDAEGNEFLTVTCALVPAYSNISAANLDPLGASVKEYADKGALIPSYNYMPDDHYAKLGAEMQKYLADQCSRADLASAVEAYWKSVA